MLRNKLESEPEPRIVQLKDQSPEMSLLAQNQTEFQKSSVRVTEPKKTSEPSEHDVEAYRSKLRQQELSLQTQRHAWQCELAEKQLLLQSRNAEIEQNRSEIALLRKRIRELELTSQQTPAAKSATAQPERTSFALSEMPKTAIREVQNASITNVNKVSAANWDPRDGDFVMGEPKLAAVQEISFTHSADENHTTDDESEKTPKFFGSRRWRIRGRKRRWRTKAEKHADSK